jgi:hypothetical protein
MLESWTSGLRARRGEGRGGEARPHPAVSRSSGRPTGTRMPAAPFFRGTDLQVQRLEAWGREREAVHGPGAGTRIQTSPVRRD